MVTLVTSATLLTSANCHRFDHFGEFSFQNKDANFGEFSFGDFSFGDISLRCNIVAPLEFVEFDSRLSLETKLLNILGAG